MNLYSISFSKKNHNSYEHSRKFHSAVNILFLEKKNIARHTSQYRDVEKFSYFDANRFSCVFTYLAVKSILNVCSENVSKINFQKILYREENSTQINISIGINYN